MARGVNKVILVATLGQDPEVRYNQSGSAMAAFTVATNEQWTDKQSGQKQEKTEWHRCVAFGKTAEIIGDYLRKGSQVYIEGKLTTRKWQDNNGNDRYTTEVSVRDIQMLGGRKDDNGGGHGGGNAAARPAQGAGQQRTGGNPQNSRPDQGYGAGGGQGNFDDFDDDIPF